LLIDRHPDALSKSVRAFLKALDHAPILVGNLLRRRGCRLLSRFLFCPGTSQQQKQRNDPA
jgi:hypothetical protein